MILHLLLRDLNILSDRIQLIRRVRLFVLLLNHLPQLIRLIAAAFCVLTASRINRSCTRYSYDSDSKRNEYLFLHYFFTSCHYFLRSLVHIVFVICIISYFFILVIIISISTSIFYNISFKLHISICNNFIYYFFFFCIPAVDHYPLFLIKDIAIFTMFLTIFTFFIIQKSSTFSLYPITVYLSVYSFSSSCVISILFPFA